MKENIKIIAMHIAIAAFIVLACIYVPKLREQRERELRSTDTIYIHKVDTHYVDSPIYIERTFVRCDTIEYLREVEKTVYDTIRIEIPVEQKHFKDTLYEAWVSGYKPNLDSIFIFNRTNTVTIHTTERVPVNQSKWGFTIGLQTGAGYVSPFGKDGGMGLYGGIGFGVSYKF